MPGRAVMNEQGVQEGTEHTSLRGPRVVDQRGGCVVTYTYHLGAARQEVQDPVVEGCCSDLASVLSSPNSQLKQLELRDNDLQDSGVTLLSAGLEDSDCKLHTLGLSGCLVTEEGCAALSSALRSNLSHLKELDLSYNHPGDSAGGLLSAALVDPTYKLMKLK
uniref:SPRY-associated domain-containing protein n=1 Tax=Hucho hucho TaxID=62062 RepID=A0A4W5LWT0_9TELE